MDIWGILGMEPSGDKRDIKRAYAKMLAKYHPEEKPETFQMIHRAYKIALQFADIELTETENRRIDGHPDIVDAHPDTADGHPDIVDAHSAMKEDAKEPFIEQESSFEAPDTFIVQESSFAEPDTSIFNKETDAFIKEWEKTGYQALAALEYAIANPGRKNALREFVKSALFEQAKSNYIFIEGCPGILSEANLNYSQLSFLRKSFLKVVREAAQPHLYQKIWICLDAKALTQFNFIMHVLTKIRNYVLLVAVPLIIVLILLAVFLQDNTQPSNEGDFSHNQLVIDSDYAYELRYTLTRPAQDIKDAIALGDYDLSQTILRMAKDHIFETRGVEVTTNQTIDFEDGNFEAYALIVFHSVDDPAIQMPFLINVRHDPRPED